ncbi:hypothetical protein LLG39_05585 [bacterium]|nr:hypothetical protein [bacterium]
MMKLNRYPITRLWLLTLPVLTVALFLFGTLAQSSNMIDNSGFEKSTSGWTLSDPGRCSAADGISHGGQKSLAITCSDGPDFITARQIHTVQGGGILHFNAWVKLADLRGTGTYMTISWYDSGGRVVERYYSSAIVGTLDWTQVSIDQRVPNGAVRLAIGLHTYPECSGMVWYDDVSAEIKDETTLRAMLRYPAYRSTIYAGQDKHATVGVEVAGNSTHPVDSLSASAVVQDRDGQEISPLVSASPASSGWSDIRLSLADAKSGNYRVLVRLKDRETGDELGKQEIDLRISDSPPPQVYVDEHSRCIVDGKPFFPVGFYTWGADREHVADLDRVVEWKFNTLIHYNLIAGRDAASVKRYLDEAERRGLKVLVSTKDCYDNFRQAPVRFDRWEGPKSTREGAVETLKGHSAILGWYINDERSDFFLPQINHTYDYIRNTDPDHLVYQVLTREQDAAAHVACTDALGTDYYPVYDFYSDKLPKVRVETVADTANRVRESVMGSRSMWQVVECSKMGSEGRSPTFQEIMCEAYLALTSGARGLFFFCLPYALENGDQQMQVLKSLGEEMERLRPFALGIDAGPVQSVVASSKEIHALTRVANGDVYVLAVNPTDNNIKAAFRTGPGLSYSSVQRYTPGSQPRWLPIVNHIFADNIESLGTRLYKFSNAAPL